MVKSYARGAPTTLGGVLPINGLVRTVNLKDLVVTEEDCGTTKGVKAQVTEGNLHTFVGRYVFLDTVPVHINTEETARKLIGKTVFRRSPMHCQHDNRKFCRSCLGDELFEQMKEVT